MVVSPACSRFEGRAQYLRLLVGLLEERALGMHFLAQARELIYGSTPSSSCCPPDPDLEAAGSILRFKMQLIKGSSIAPEIIQKMRSHADGVDRVLVSASSYCILFDTVVEDRP